MNDKPTQIGARAHLAVRINLSPPSDARDSLKCASLHFEDSSPTLSEAAQSH
jgi:hypothetical protein